MVGDRLLRAEQLVRAADAAAHARLLELAGEHGGQLRDVGTLGTPLGSPRRIADSSPGRIRGETARNGRCGSASRTISSALRDGTACGPSPP